MVAASLALLSGGAWWWHDDRATRFLPADTATFVTRFAAPPAPESPRARAELDQLLELQQGRSPEDVAAARADRKTEVARFYGALGFEGEVPDLPRVEELAERVEDDVRIYVRAVKDHFRRLRPYEIEPRLSPCIDDVRGDLSYPSGHAAFSHAMYQLLTSMVPERAEALARRADVFARQRMVCGVHFPSDLEAGKLAAQYVMDALASSPEYRTELAGATAELRTALRLPQLPPGS
jgi:acid phosphatase (class A)